MTVGWFEMAVEAEETEYVEAERVLRDLVRAEPDQRAAVAARLDDPDPIARLVASVVLSDADLDEPQAAQVETYLVSALRSFARTPAGTPPVPAVVAELTARFGSQLGELLALRLAKGPSTPPWREAVSLAYLTQHPTRAATEALLRYVSRTTEPRLQSAAAHALVAIGDPDLRDKLAAEARRLAATGRALPTAVTSVLA